VVTGLSDEVRHSAVFVSSEGADDDSL
jgi:hypothetical protein